MFVVGFTRMLATLGLLAGCIQPQLLPCGDLLCPVDSVCLPSGQCATQESLDACNGLADGAACMTTTVDGSCQSGVCTAPRCGDGVISGSEQCDGPVSGVDCVDYGFDTGIPTCSDHCGLDVVGSCVNFGWKRVSSVSAGVAWTNGSLQAVLSVDAKQLTLHRDGQLLQSAASGAPGYHSLAGAGSTIVANTSSTIVRSDNGGPFVDVPTTGLPQTDSIVQLAEDGTIFVLAVFADHIEVWKSAATGWQQILTTTQLAHQFRWTGGALYVCFDDGTVRRYASGSFSNVLFTTPDSVLDLADRDGVLYLILNGPGAYKFDGTLTPLSNDSYFSVAATPSGVYFGAGLTSVARYIDGPVQRFNAPIYGSLITDGTDLYIYGSGIYGFTGMAWSSHDGIGEPVTDISLLASHELAVTTVIEVLTDSSPYFWNHNTPTESPIAIAGHDGNDFFVTGGLAIDRFNGVDFTAQQLPAGIPQIADLAWDDSTSTLYAVGAQGLGMKRSGASTTFSRFSDIAGCDLHAIALGAPTIYAAGSCGAEGVVWSLAGTTWTELHRSSVPFVAIGVDAAENVYAAGPDGGLARVAGTWHDEPRARGTSISATNPNDIWVGGGPDDVVHYDGTVWSRVAIIGPASPHVLATPSTVYMGGASQPMLLRR